MSCWPALVCPRCRAVLDPDCGEGDVAACTACGRAARHPRARFHAARLWHVLDRPRLTRGVGGSVYASGRVAA